MWSVAETTAAMVVVSPHAPRVRDMNGRQPRRLKRIDGEARGRGGSTRRSCESEPRVTVVVVTVDQRPIPGEVAAVTAGRNRVTVAVATVDQRPIPGEVATTAAQRRAAVAAIAGQPRVLAAGAAAAAVIEEVDAAADPGERFRFVASCRVRCQTLTDPERESRVRTHSNEITLIVHYRGSIARVSPVAPFWT